MQMDSSSDVSTNTVQGAIDLGAPKPKAPPRTKNKEIVASVRRASVSLIPEGTQLVETPTVTPAPRPATTSSPSNESTITKMLQQFFSVFRTQKSRASSVESSTSSKEPDTVENKRHRSSSAELHSLSKELHTMENKKTWDIADWQNVSKQLQIADPDPKSNYNKLVKPKIDQLNKCMDQFDRAVEKQANRPVKQQNTPSIKARDNALVAKNTVRLKKAKKELFDAILMHEKTQKHAEMDELVNEKRSLEAKLTLLNEDSRIPAAQKTNERRQIRESLKENELKLTAAVNLFKKSATAENDKETSFVNGSLSMIKSRIREYPVMNVSQLYGNKIGDKFLEDSCIAGNNMDNLTALRLTDFCTKPSGEGEVVSKSDKNTLKNSCEFMAAELRTRQTRMLPFADDPFTQDQLKDLAGQIKAIEDTGSYFSKEEAISSTVAKNKVEQLFYDNYINRDGGFALNAASKEEMQLIADWKERNPEDSPDSPSLNSTNLRNWKSNIESELDKQVLHSTRSGHNRPGIATWETLPSSTQDLLIYMTTLGR